MQLAEHQKLKEMRDAEWQYARIERAVLWVAFLTAIIVMLASFVALSYQATYGQKECYVQLEGAQQRSRDFADGLAEIQRLAHRLTP